MPKKKNKTEEKKVVELKLPVFNEAGEKVGEQELRADVFGILPNPGLVNQAVLASRSTKRQVLAHVKTRGEVRGGGKKPWKQKGTGRARHGSVRSPIWIGGGAIFGPTHNRNFILKINKKVKRAALLMALGDKVANGKIILLDQLEMPEIKTKKMVEITRKLGKKIKMELEKGLLIILPEKNEKVEKSINNLPKIDWLHANNLNIIDILKRPFLLTTVAGVKKIEEIYKKKKK